MNSVSGRPAHVAKLRSEFDTGKSLQLLCFLLDRLSSVLTTFFQWTGADYHLVDSDPGDLDPHAVASIFKAYLRECMFPPYIYRAHNI